MRRKEKAITKQTEIDRILAEGQICRLAMVNGDAPYLVPMNYGYGDGKLFLHSAPEGKKIDILKQHPQVWFEVTGRTSMDKKDVACSWGMSYECVMGSGTASFLNSTESRTAALNTIMSHYSKTDDWEFKANSFAATEVIEIEIEHLTAKGSGELL